MAILRDWCRGDDEPADGPSERDQAEAAQAAWELDELERQATDWLLSQGEDDRSAE